SAARWRAVPVSTVRARAARPIVRSPAPAGQGFRRRTRRARAGRCRRTVARLLALEVRRNRRVDVDPNRLGLGVIVHRLATHLTAIARLADAAERTARIDALVAVDPAHACANLAREPVRALQVAGPEPAAEPVVGAVRDRQRLVVGGKACHGDKWA